MISSATAAGSRLRTTQHGAVTLLPVMSGGSNRRWRAWQLHGKRRTVIF
jgi:hypothetical protein